MSVFWNDRVRRLSPYTPGEQPKNGASVIKLNTNENPYPPSPSVIEAVTRAAASLRLYPDPSAMPLREALAEKFSLSVENVFCSNGSDEVLAFCFGAFFPEKPDGGRPVLFPDITYSFYPVYCGLWNTPFCEIPAGDDFSINFNDYNIPNGGVIFPNPNAPTSIAQTKEAVLKAAGFQMERRRVLVVDEAYVEFCGETVAPYIKEYENLLVVQTFSKAASLAGLRVGYALGNARLIQALERARDSFNSYPVDALACAAAAAAVRDWDYSRKMNRRIIASREKTISALRAMGWKVLPSSANFIFASPPAVQKGDVPDAAGVFQKLREKGFLTRYFPKERVKKFLRISIGSEEEMDLFLKCCMEPL
ncbi:MAG: histidinol-phosphate transaminase [Spirochaetaceae bacterium]|nr:histidinol-phosphate transaminase [Spirochaetaceae bacterium]